MALQVNRKADSSNRPFPNSKNFHFQNEAKGKTFVLCHENELFACEWNINIANLWLRTAPRFETEAWDDSKEAYCTARN